MNHLQAADALASLGKELSTPIVDKRPIPNTLLSDKSIWVGCLSLAILGTGPTAMTPSDAERMNLNPPIHKKQTDKILISRSRLINALFALNVISSTSSFSEDILSINLLWNDAITLQQSKKKSNQQKTYDSIELEHCQSKDLPDLVPLGFIKSALYGLNLNTRKYCLPCTTSSSLSSHQNLRRSNGELVRHHPAYCRLCRYFVVQEDDVIQEEKEKEGIDNLLCQGEELELESMLSDGEETSSKNSKASLLSHLSDASNK